MISFDEFKRQCNGRGLRAVRCSQHHWQIADGEHLVNVWANSKRGFKYQPAGAEKGICGNLHAAIEAAGEAVSPPWEEKSETPTIADRRSKLSVRNVAYCALAAVVAPWAVLIYVAYWWAVWIFVFRN